MDDYPTPGHVTVEAAARRLELGRAAVRYHCREGNLKAVKVGRTYLISKRSLERFARERQQRETPQ